RQDRREWMRDKAQPQMPGSASCSASRADKGLADAGWPRRLLSRMQPGRRHVGPDLAARPPVARRAAPPRGPQAICVERRANPAGRRVGEWIAAEETKDPAVAVERPRHEGNEPRMLRVRGHRGKPHQPIQAQMIGGDLWRTTGRIAWLAFELVRAPLRSMSHR